MADVVRIRAGFGHQDDPISSSFEEPADHGLTLFWIAGGNEFVEKYAGDVLAVSAFEPRHEFALIVEAFIWGDSTIEASNGPAHRAVSMRAVSGSPGEMDTTHRATN